MILTKEIIKERLKKIPKSSKILVKDVCLGVDCNDCVLYNDGEDCSPFLHNLRQELFNQKLQKLLA